MHETAIAASLLEQVQQYISPDAVLQQVHLQIGRMEHLEETVFRTAWTALTAHTSFANSALTIEWVPLRVRCRNCQNEYTPEDQAIMLCPQCESAYPEILQGSGIILKSLDVDFPGNASSDTETHKGISTA